MSVDRAARLLHAAAATLAAGVVTDSTAEHYRAGFHNRVMFAAPAASAAALVTALAAAASPARQPAARQAVFAACVITGVVGFAFHLGNVSRRPGGWSSANVFHGAPMAAPLGITMAGLLGLAAPRIDRVGRAVGLASALGLMGTATEAGALHFRGAFQNPLMYAPVVLPPAAAAALAGASLTNSLRARSTAGALLRATAWLGMTGAGLHAWGVHRRMGGWRNWRQNLLAGPPLPAPPAFTGLALAGLASLEVLEPDTVR